MACILAPGDAALKRRRLQQQRSNQCSACFLLCTGGRWTADARRGCLHIAVQPADAALVGLALLSELRPSAFVAPC
jgi:hypothetical protein